MSDGHVTVRYENKDGKEKVEDEHMDLQGPGHGLIPVLLKNVQRDALPSSVSFVAATPNPDCEVGHSRRRHRPVFHCRSARKATHYV